MSAGILNHAKEDTKSVMVPPKITDGIVPINEAATPLSNCPNSLLLFIKTELTEDTLPRILSGTNSWKIVPRMITLTPSNRPLTNKIIKLKIKDFDNAKMIIQTPKPATA